ncbi:unnamed protein product, partial [Sphenostylis stenocarpa]
MRAMKLFIAVMFSPETIFLETIPAIPGRIFQSNITHNRSLEELHDAGEIMTHSLLILLRDWQIVTIFFFLHCGEERFNTYQMNGFQYSWNE